MNLIAALLTGVLTVAVPSLEQAPMTAAELNAEAVNRNFRY